jgi:hypothetical protein
MRPPLPPRRTGTCKCNVRAAPPLLRCWMDVLPRGARRKFVVPSHLMDRSTDRWRATAGVHGTVDVVTSTEQMPGRSEPLFEERGSAFMSCLLLA